MHIFVYEWVTGGGLLGHEGPLLDSLLTKGLTMVRAASEDFSRLPNARVTILRDLRVPQLAVRGCEVREVDSASDHHDAFESFCREADATLLIAPETDGVLLATAREAERCRARLVSPGSEFVAVASDKHQTAEHLAAAGVPAPRGVVLEPEEPLPADFDYPAVLKPIDGAGSHDTLIVAGHHESPPAYAWPRRLEAYIVGVPVSVAVLCGPGGATSLAPTRQRLSSDGQLRYLGGEVPIAAGLANRAQRLAVAAVEALPACVGYVGVDLVLGTNPDGSGDHVIEVNPRLTTSYAGLRFAAGANLAGAMLDAVAGQPLAVTFDGRAIEFGADGVVSFLD